MSAKYPRTPHLPDSPGATRDDRRLESYSSFLNRELVVTEKLDGSNVAMTRREVFARSHSGPPKHPSFDELKAVHARVATSIPLGVTIFGEWCAAVHSIEYEQIPPGPHVFAVRYDDLGTWASWGRVVYFSEYLGLPHACVLNHPWMSQTEATVRQIVEGVAGGVSCFGDELEGVVLRWMDGFEDEEFGRAVAKRVRAKHVQTDEHWAHGPIRWQRRPQGVAS